MRGVRHGDDNAAQVSGQGWVRLCLHVAVSLENNEIFCIVFDCNFITRFGVNSRFYC